MQREPFRAVALVALAAAAALLALAVPAAAHGHHHHGHHHHGHHHHGHHGHHRGHGHDHGFPRHEHPRDHGDHRDHGVTIVRPGDSIQAAIDAAAPGATIVVKPGTYAENLTITTDGITLKGRDATLVPPATPGAPSPCSFGGPAGDGICVAGQGEFSQEGPSTVTDPIEDVTIAGFTVKGFPSIGIVFLGAVDPVVRHDRAQDNGAYGIARFVSSGGAILGNDASGSGEAGIYVGDSPDADVLVAGNRSHENELFGFFFRDAANGRAVANESFGNCVGAIVLNTGPNIAGDWRFFANTVHDNDRFCPPDEEEGSPPLSGIGIAIVNASENVVIGNVIRDNVASGDVPFAGGVVVVDAGSPGAEPPSRNLVKGNVILGNQPDIFWDGSGTDNVIMRNLCRTSVPDGLCEASHGGHRPHGGDQGHRPGDRHDD